MDTKELIFKLRMYGMPCHGESKTLMQTAADMLEEQQNVIEKLSRERDGLRVLIESVG